MDNLDTTTSGGGEVTSIDQIRDKISSLDSGSATQDNTTTQTAPSSHDLKESKEKDVETPEIEAKAEEKPTKEVIIPAKEVEEVKEGTESKFVPDFKFKAWGKDLEVPENLRPLFTDEKTQTELKSILAKSYGLDTLLPKYDEVKEKITNYEQNIIPQYKKQDQIISELASYVEKRDFDSYFERLGIKEKDLQEWMYKKLSLTPEQQALYNENRELQKQLYKQTTTNQELAQTAEATKQEFEKEQEQKILNALDYVVTNGAVKDVAKSFDSTNGAGAFKNSVIKFAAFKQQTEGKNLSVEEAIEEFTKFANLKPTTASQAVGGQVSLPKEKPTLPVTNAKAYSPSNQQITSIKQIRQKANAYVPE